MSELGSRGREAGKSGAEIPRHVRASRRVWATVGKVAASVVAVVLVSVASLGAIAAANLASSAPKSIHLVGEPKAGQAAPDIGALQGGVNILVAASDTRSGQGGTYGTTSDSSGVGLNDVTMLLHLSKDHKNATVVSFPRDLMIPIPACPDGHGGENSAMYQAPLNTTLSDGGMACTVLTIEQLTGLKIPYAGLIEFNGVVAMSNAVGGVPVCIGGNGIHDPDTNLDLNPGEVTLKGVEAAQFLRTRHGVVGGSDLARISNQQVFLSSLMRTITSAGTLTNPAKVWGLAKAANDNIALSDSLKNVTTLYQIAMALKGLNFGDIVFLQYPALDDPDDSARVIPDQGAADTLFTALKADQPVKLSGTTGQGAVLAPGSTPPPTTPTTTPPASTDPTSTSTPGAPVVLPQNVTGQTAATKTCSNGD